MNAARHTLFGVALLVLSGFAVAQEMSAKAVAISSPTLLKALIALQQQTGLQFICPTDGTGETVVPALHGTYTPRAAVEKLLKDTGIKYEFINERTVAISSNRRAAAKSLRTSEVASDAMAAEAGPEGPRGNGESQATVEGAKVDGQAPEEAAGAPLAQVVVTGTHIRGIEPVGAKLIVVDREYIDRSGYSSVQDVLNTLVQTAPGPSEDFPSGARTGTYIGNSNFGSAVNLRGLGAGATLVLVNGVRQASSTTTGSFVDVSNIPMAAIERIEVLPDGASALYGSDAIGGVVNIVLRKNYQGFEARARFGTLDGDSSEIRISPMFGTSWDGGHAIVGYEYYKREALAMADRAYAASSDQRPRGGDDFSDIASNPGNILCPFGREDCAFFEPVFAIPRGQNGTSLSPADLLPGVVNLQNINAGQDFIPYTRRDSGFFDISQKLGDRFEIFANGRYTERPVSAVDRSAGTFLVVPSSNAFFVDPFQDSSEVYLAYNLSEDFPARFDGLTRTYNGVLGSTVTVGKGWRVLLQSSYAEEKMTSHFRNVNEEALAAALAESDPERTYNPFGEGANTNPAVIEALRLTNSLAATSSTFSSNLHMDGPLFAMRGGLARLALGLDYREETLDTQLIAGVPSTRPPKMDRSDSAMFTELVLPLIGEANARPMLRRLEASLAARYEDYSDWGDTVVPKVGLSWSPVTSMKFRASWGESFKAPRLVDRDTTVFNPVTILQSVYEDPQSPSGSSLALVRYGGNPDLREERGVEWTAGVDFFPQFAPGLSVSLTYFDSRYKDRTSTPGTPGREDRLLLEESLWASVINRTPTQAQIDELCNSPAFPFGAEACTLFPPSLIIDMRLQNIAVTAVSGIDFDVRKALDTRWGNFDFQINGSRVFHNEFALASTTPRKDLLDQAGGPLSLKMRGMMTWSYQSMSAHARLNYAPAYDDPFGRGGLIRPVSSWTTLDVGYQYHFGNEQRWLDGTTVVFNVVNALDRDPPFVNAAAGYDAANADPYGRLMSLEMIKAF